MACPEAPCHCSATGMHIAAQGQQHRAVDQLVTAGVLICDGRIGLCCVYVVFLVAYPYGFINRDVDVNQGIELPVSGCSAIW